MQILSKQFTVLLALTSVSLPDFLYATEEQPEIQENERYKSMVDATIRLGRSFRDLTDQGKYQKVLRRMSKIGLPEIILNQLTSDENYIHPYILDVTYSYLKCVRELGRTLVNSDPSSCMMHYKKGIKNGEKFWEYYKTIRNINYDNYINSSLGEIIAICHDYIATQPVENDNTLSIFRTMLSYDSILIERLQASLALKENAEMQDQLGLKRYNQLTHIISYLPLVKNEHETNKHLQEIDRIILYLKESNHRLYAAALDQKDTFGKLILNPPRKTTFARLSKQSKARLLQKDHKEKAEMFAKYTASNQEILPLSNLIGVHISEIDQLVKASDLEYIHSKNRQKCILSYQVIAKKILETEEKIYEFLTDDKYALTEEALIIVYKNGTEKLGALLKPFLYKSVWCFMNSGDYYNALLRFDLYEKLVEKFPKKYHYLQLYFKFILGYPAEWDKHVQKQKEAKSKKKLAARQNTAAVIKLDLEQKDSQEKKKIVAKQPNMQFRGEKEDVEVLPARNAELGYFYSPTIEETTPVGRHPEKNEKVKRKHWSDYSMVFVRHPAASEKEEKVKEEEKERENTKFFISSSARKVYISLYSQAPRFTPEGASNLLEAFGMQLEGGKGSHKKYALANVLSGGRRILDQENNAEIFRFPDIANASYVGDGMMVIPRWEGNQPPAYMIGALRHILERRGAKESNVFKKNENEKH